MGNVISWTFECENEQNIPSTSWEYFFIDFTNMANYFYIMYETLPSSSIDSNVTLKWKQQKNK
jgi:hypothetical protein